MITTCRNWDHKIYAEVFGIGTRVVSSSFGQCNHEGAINWDEKGSVRLNIFRRKVNIWHAITSWKYKISVCSWTTSARNGEIVSRWRLPGNRKRSKVPYIKESSKRRVRSWAAFTNFDFRNWSTRKEKMQNNVEYKSREETKRDR